MPDKGQLKPVRIPGDAGGVPWLLGKIVEKCEKLPEQPFENRESLWIKVRFFQISIDF